MQNNSSNRQKPRIAIIGGGVAGATAAVHLGEQGLDVVLMERGPSLVNGPPICHLHAGGNLYREISQQQCLELLRQSVETIRLYRHTVNKRPTVIATPTTDPEHPQALLPRLEAVKQAYQAMVQQDARNEVLGDPDEYYRLYDRADLERLKLCTQPNEPVSMDDWLIPFAKHVDLALIQYPVIVVQEYGWSVFRLAATAMLTLQQLPHCQLLTNSTLVDAQMHDGQWHLTYHDKDSQSHTLVVDYLVNACGYETGKLDDLTKNPQYRMAEFKAAYIAKWPDEHSLWPEVIFHGQRGTPQGMAQLTPYADGVFQLHGMTKAITLFDDGLTRSSTHSSQPVLPDVLQMKLTDGWPDAVVEARTRHAIAHIGKFIPDYCRAYPDGKPLFGAQQIPGEDETLRAADVSFSGHNYARIEIVKGSSALEAARKLMSHWQLGHDSTSASIEQQHPISLSFDADRIEQFAIDLAQTRGYPIELAKIIGC
ncbi:FAD-dependent oxidoreductase [Vibrio gazogenes]|uniref:FAD dependent oxidoreductase n=1 Tax=Vibrio gazogenes DSM 21264 = NBRC 103151 TaxID=1123492 RepID=A0A1M4VK23_VIBGA|nr:FAD-dependent oxidoreductase [Vibrio gazogenes]USP15523.1 FAD-binding oxidoreductase [Vibrio gazogenes]SHE69361.1 FAD dependent oxidoreductase [Vibrio gazogenes DSM 21264] [Vibrio gazogenes DSM 21264 = NBRC 103151]SJN57367.1 3-(3-hydroxyphenyl)propionate hydroxylase [Vibrio gazogenes]